jgi:Ulp1 family protease
LFYFPFVVGNEINTIAADLPQCMIGYLTVSDGELMEHLCRNSKCSVKMQQEQFKVLRPGQWFMDLVIGFWLKRLTCNEDYYSCSMFVFSTYFYDLLVQEDLE